MKSLKELVGIIDRHGRVRTAEGLCIAVLVDDARRAYGRINDHVSSRAGEGGALVTSHRVELEGNA
jgi:hypothetical protein